ncbi:hypothetical protein JL720_6878 [Aureococcus anophagefferens]|nr:hypothetical protein JL720_6878 [Aureococcus anophagefferens]
MMTAAPEIAWGVLVRTPDTDARHPQFVALCAESVVLGRRPERYHGARADRVRLAHSRVSGVQCLLHVNLDGVRLEQHARASNETKVNGHTIADARRLESGDTITLLQSRDVIKYDYFPAGDAGEDRLVAALEARGRGAARELAAVREEAARLRAAAADDARRLGAAEDALEALRRRELDALAADGAPGGDDDDVGGGFDGGDESMGDDGFGGDGFGGGDDDVGDDGGGGFDDAGGGGDDRVAPSPDEFGLDAFLKEADQERRFARAADAADGDRTRRDAELAAAWPPTPARTAPVDDDDDDGARSSSDDGASSADESEAPPSAAEAFAGLGDDGALRAFSRSASRPRATPRPRRRRAARSWPSRPRDSRAYWSRPPAR